MGTDTVDLPPFALTDQHSAALERAIRAAGYEIKVDPESGDVRLERQIVEREWFEREEMSRIEVENGSLKDDEAQP